jgi:hypothetical protein
MPRITDVNGNTVYENHLVLAGRSIFPMLAENPSVTP